MRALVGLLIVTALVLYGQHGKSPLARRLHTRANRVRFIIGLIGCLIRLPGLLIAIARSFVRGDGAARRVLRFVTDLQVSCFPPRQPQICCM